MPLFLTMALQKKAFLIVSVAYLIAFAFSILTAYIAFQQGWSLLWTLFLADCVGTIIIFLSSYIYDNSSFYDPYWSVIPIVLAVCLAYWNWEEGILSVRGVATLTLVSFWGLRLTYNWARGWKGLHHQDWRYVDLQQKHGKWYWAVSFSGIHFMPTVLVFLGCLPLFPIFEQGQPLNWLDAIGILFTLSAILIELIADEQLHTFVKNKKQVGETLTSGLWAYSRHPNYLGEVGFWWGLFLIGLAANLDYWWTIIGPISISLLFHFISIPMIDQRMLARRGNYQEIMERIPRWIPFFN